MWMAAKARAQKIGIPFRISVDDLVVPTHCPVLGMKLESSVGQVADACPSIDRFIITEGYVPGNVRVISFRANTLKRDATVAELEAVIEYMRGVR